MDPSDRTVRDTRQRILATARELFHRHGYCETGINTICRDADVVKGSFYHYFASKDDLLAAVIDLTAAELLDRIDATAAAAPDGRGRVLAHFEYVLNAAQVQQGRAGRILGCAIGRLAGAAPAGESTALAAGQAALRAWRDRLDRHIREGVEDGSIAASVEPGPTALSLLAAIQGMSALGRCFDDPDMLRTLGRNTVKRLLPLGPAARIRA